MPASTIQETFDQALQHHKAGRLDDAIVGYCRVIALAPTFADAYYNLGIAFKRNGHLDHAIVAYRKAVALQPDHANAHYNLANALRHQRQFEDAIAAYRAAISLRPDYADAHCNLGIALKNNGQFDEAVAAYQQAIAIRSDYAKAHSNLGIALQEQGQIDEAIAAHRRAIAAAPNNASFHSNLLFTLYFQKDSDAPEVLAEHRRWNDRHARPLASSIAPHDNDRSPTRRLRIGYVSPNFCDHCQSFFTLPLLANHDHESFEIFCYSSVMPPDNMTRRLTSYADTWHNIASASDAELAEQIRRDRIDILVDLTMHMAHGRPLLMARKPAPVQVAWLAYPGTTGIETMDYRLTDPYLDPSENDGHYSEKSIRLPDSFWCYDSLTNQPTVNDLPALTNGHITFGCLNNFCKVNDGILSLWAQVLGQVKNSRLLLLTGPGSQRQQALDRLSQEGIDPARIEFIPRQSRPKYLELYHRIDLGLDSFPSNGHTTSLDSFWMGVPVVTLVGTMAVSRAGWCQLSNLRLPELAGHIAEQFVRIAVELASDLPRLEDLRRTLRWRMEQSPLMNAPKFARSIEAAYRQMWQGWCEKVADVR